MKRNKYIKSLTELQNCPVHKKRSNGRCYWHGVKMKCGKSPCDIYTIVLRKDER